MSKCNDNSCDNNIESFSLNGIGDHLEEKNLKIITLCGSTKFRQAFVEIDRILTLEGYIVLKPGHFRHSGDGKLSKEESSHLHELHKRKIELSSIIYIVDVGTYIGQTTREEIEYAKKLRRHIKYLSTDEQMRQRMRNAGDILG